jgi:hypothetical protein
LAILQIYGKGLTRITQIRRISRKNKKKTHYTALARGASVRFIRAIRVKDFQTLRKPYPIKNRVFTKSFFTSKIIPLLWSWHAE